MRRFLRSALLGVSLLASTVASTVIFVRVTPDGGAASAPASSSGNRVTFSVENTTTAGVTYNLTCTWAGQVSGCTAPDQLFVDAQTTVQVDATYDVGAAGSGTVTLRARDAGNSSHTDTGFFNVTVTPAPPLADSSAWSWNKEDYSRCAASCFAATYAQATVPYFSLDAPRNITLSYNGDRLDPKPFIAADIQAAPGTSPTQFWLEAQYNGTDITFLNGETLLKFVAPGDNSKVRLSGQFDAAANSMGATKVYDITIIVTAYFSDGSTSATSSAAKVTVVNENSSPVARGWTLAGIQHLYSQSNGALITEGDGSATFYSGTGPYTRPAGEFAELSWDGGSSNWYRKYPDSTKILFNSSGQMISITDRFGNATGIYYNGSQVQAITDPFSLDLSLSYDANGLHAVSDPFGRTTQVTVNGSRLLTAIQDPDNVSTGFGYDGANRLSTITDRRSKTTTLRYGGGAADVAGKLAWIKSPQVPIYGVGTDSLVTTFSSWQRATTPYGLTGTGGSPFTPIATASVTGSVTDRGGHQTTYLSINRFGSAARVDAPIGHSYRYTFTSDGLLKTSSDALDAGLGTDSLAYDASGRVLAVYKSGLSPVSIRYGTFGQVDSTWGPGKVAQRVFLGTSGRADSVRIGGYSGQPAASQHVTRYTYDSRGRVLQTSDTYGVAPHLLVKTEYAGANGNRSRDSMPGNRQTFWFQDSYGRDTLMERNGADDPRRTWYDAINRVRAVAHHGGLGDSTEYRYDNLYLTQVLDPKGQLYQFTYNDLGWVTGRQDPVNSVWDSEEYDRDGLLRHFTNRRGQGITYTYDAEHRKTGKSGTNASTESWSYSTNGREITATSAVTATITGLNKWGGPDSAVDVYNGTTLKRFYSYNSSNGLLTQLAGTGLTTRTYGYNLPQMTLDTIKLAGAATVIAHDANLNSSTVTFPSGYARAFAYTTLEDLWARSTNAPYSGTVNRDASFEGSGRVDTHGSTAGSLWRGSDYSYDALGRLKDNAFVYVANQWCGGFTDDGGRYCSQAFGVDSSRDFAHDANANVSTLTSYDGSGNTINTASGTYNGNRITNFNGCDYTTDADGNDSTRTCSGVVTTFWWSAENRLDSLNDGSNTYRNSYDAGGRLIKRDFFGNQRYYLWDGVNLLAEYNGSVSLLAEYSYYPGLDRIHAVIKSGTPYYAHADALGNVIALTSDADQSVKRTYVYDEFGKLIGGSDYLPFGDETDRPRFKGALFMGMGDGGLYYMRSRWYEPLTGRFSSEDPAGLQGGINPYAYGGSDPVNHVDPTGSYWICYKESADPDDAPDCGWSDRSFDLGASGWEFGLGRLGQGFAGFGVGEGGAGGGGSLPRCGGGFSVEDCSQLWSEATRLTGHESALCRALGENAQQRILDHRYIFLGGAPLEGWAFDLGRVASGDLPAARGRIGISISGMVLLNATMPHEEYHYYNPQATHEEVYRVGFSCGH